MAFDSTKPINGSQIVAAELRSQFNGLKDLIDIIPVGPQGPAGAQGEQGVPGAQGDTGPQGPQGEPGGTNPELDPVFTASEAAQLVPGDKAKLDSAIQPGTNVSQLANDAGYMANPMGPGIGDIIYNGWDGVNPGGVKPRTLPGGTEGQVLTVGRIDGMIAPTWADAFVDNSSGANWASSAPTNVNDAINRMAAAVASLLGTPIP